MNALPQATAFEINPRDLYPRDDIAAIKRRLYSPRKASKRREESKPAIVYMADRRPPGRIWREQHDSHVGAWVEWQANPPLAFLKMRCREMGVRYQDIIGSSLKRVHTDPRSKLMAEVKIRFPEISFPQLGRLFGGRDHTTCIFALRKHGVVTGTSTKYYARVDREADRVLSMLRAGKLQKEIAAELGSSATAVSGLVKRRGWQDVNPYRPPRLVSDHADEVRRLFDQGKSGDEIGRAIGFRGNSVRNFIRRQGWRG